MSLLYEQDLRGGRVHPEEGTDSQGDPHVHCAGSVRRGVPDEVCLGAAPGTAPQRPPGRPRRRALNGGGRHCREAGQNIR